MSKGKAKDKEIRVFLKKLNGTGKLAKYERPPISLDKICGSVKMPKGLSFEKLIREAKNE